MNINFTARHFKAPAELQRFAESAVAGLEEVYEGIVSADIVLEERPRGNGSKVAEVMVSVYREQLVAKEESHDIQRSVQACVEKLERQLRRYKVRLHWAQRRRDVSDMATG